MQADACADRHAHDGDNIDSYAIADRHAHHGDAHGLADRRVHACADVDSYALADRHAHACADVHVRACSACTISCRLWAHAHRHA